MELYFHHTGMQPTAAEVHITTSPTFNILHKNNFDALNLVQGCDMPIRCSGASRVAKELFLGRHAPYEAQLCYLNFHLAQNYTQLTPPLVYLQPGREYMPDALRSQSRRCVVHII